MAPKPDPAAALQYHRKMLDMAQTLADKDPADRRARYDLVHASTRVGSELAEMGHAQEALEQLRKAVQIGNAVSETDPAYYLMRLRVAYGEAETADVLAGLGRTAEGLGHAGKAVGISDALLKVNPRHTGAQRMMLISVKARVRLAGMTENAAAVADNLRSGSFRWLSRRGRPRRRTGR